MPGRPEGDAQPLPDPLTARRRLSGILRAARETAGLSRREACARLEWSPSKLVRIEDGSIGLQVTDLKAMLELYGGAGGHDVGELRSLALAGRRPARAWHHPYGAILSPGTAVYLSFESSATRVGEHCSLGVPPLLQTDDYARAMLRALGAPCIEQQVALLAERRRRLAAAAAGAIAYTLDEGVLHRRVGGAAVMSAQVAGLHEIARSFGAEVAIIPWKAGAYPLPQEAFTIVESGTRETYAFNGLYDRQEAPGAGAGYRADLGTIRGMCLAPGPAARLTARISAQMTQEALAAAAAAVEPLEAGG